MSKICRTLVVISMIALFGACANPDNYLWWSDVESISGAGVQDHKGVMELGQSLQLTAMSKDKSVEWTSSNESVATVDQNGVVTALSLGETTIRVYPKDVETAANGNYVVITVKNKSIPFVDDALDQALAE